jgi:hypothetical protein
MKNQNRNVNKDKKATNDFLYAMGIKGIENNDRSGIESPMDFAYAMGLSRYTGHQSEKKAEPISAPITAKLKFI